MTEPQSKAYFFLSKKPTTEITSHVKYHCISCVYLFKSLNLTIEKIELVVLRVTNIRVLAFLKSYAVQTLFPIKCIVALRTKAENDSDYILVLMFYACSLIEVDHGMLRVGKCFVFR